MTSNLCNLCFQCVKIQLERQWKFSLLWFGFQFYFQISTALSFRLLIPLWPPLLRHFKSPNPIWNSNLCFGFIVTNLLQDTSQNDFNLALLRLPSKPLISLFLSDNFQWVKNIFIFLFLLTAGTVARLVGSSRKLRLSCSSSARGERVITSTVHIIVR